MGGSGVRYDHEQDNQWQRTMLRSFLSCEFLFIPATDFHIGFSSTVSYIFCFQFHPRLFFFCVFFYCSSLSLFLRTCKLLTDHHTTCHHPPSTISQSTSTNSFANYQNASITFTLKVLYLQSFSLNLQRETKSHFQLASQHLQHCAMKDTTILQTYKTSLTTTTLECPFWSMRKILKI